MQHRMQLSPLLTEEDNKFYKATEHAIKEA
jgi:hypothetical protein